MNDEDKALFKEPRDSFVKRSDPFLKILMIMLWAPFIIIVLVFCSSFDEGPLLPKVGLIFIVFIIMNILLILRIRKLRNPPSQE